MLPVSLTIEGLYSYKKQQTIDFTQLTSNQIFGIFGEVGSGKSSILEAIVFALFGETDRLNSRDNRYYNMMNLQSDRMLIDFECKAGTDYKEDYRFIFEARRNSKNFDDVVKKGKGRRVMMKKNGDWFPLEDWSTEEIIGMNYNNFRQTIIIPQGKFREFIEQRPTERTKMMQEIFRLNDFDLYDKTKSVYFKNEKLLTTNNALKSNLEIYSKEKIDLLETNISEKQAVQKKVNLEFKDKQKQYEHQNILKQLFEELEQQSKVLADLNNQKETFHDRKKVLERYKLAFTYLREKLLSQKKLKKEITDKQIEIEKYQNDIQKLQSDIQNTEVAFQKVEKAYLNRDNDKKKCEELRKIIASIDLKSSLKEKLNENEFLRSKLDSEVKVLESYEIEFLNLEEKIEVLKKQQPDIASLIEAKNIFEKLETNGNEKYILENKLKKSQAIVDEIIIRKNSLLKDLGFESLNNLSVSELIKEFKNKLEEESTRVNLFNEKIQSLKVKKEFSSHAVNLKEGEPCPLCGAEHHPAITKTEKVDQELKLLEEEKNHLEVFQKKLFNTEKELIKSNVSSQKEEESLLILKKEITEKQLQIDELMRKKGVSKDVSKDKDQVEKSITSFNETEINIKKHEKSLKERKEKSENIKKSLELKKEILHRSESDILKIQTKLETTLADIVLLKSLIDKPKEQLEISLTKGEKQIAEAESNFKQLGEKLQKHKEVKSKLEGSFISEKKQLQSLEMNLKGISEEIILLIKDHHFQDEHEIIKLLSEKINVIEEEKAINLYNQKLQVAIQSLETLKFKTQGKNFDVNSYNELTQTIKLLDNQRITIEKEIAVLNKDIVTTKEKFEEKKRLEQLISQLEEKAENIKTLQNLFKSKGFVEYVSTVYLQNLVMIANKRFMKLTRNNLSLELNESNDFIVRDFLNNGKTRLLKTLSGGQMFQAALCLALALAENIRSLNKAEKSFFFLDEGFGTLDKSSLQTVFATLKSLKKEQRIVGVISHIEDLQQEIDVALKIENDKEKGSLISYSWEQ